MALYIEPCQLEETWCYRKPTCTVSGINPCWKVGLIIIENFLYNGSQTSFNWGIHPPPTKHCLKHHFVYHFSSPVGVYIPIPPGVTSMATVLSLSLITCTSFKSYWGNMWREDEKELFSVTCGRKTSDKINVLVKTYERREKYHNAKSLKHNITIT